MTVFANSSGLTTVRHALTAFSRDVHRIGISSPFFSYSSLLEEITTSGQIIDLVVRLGVATPPYELRAAISLPNVRIRFYTSSLFHSKLYIFGDQCALVGSANLTQTGMQSNREVTITVPSDHPDFDELVSLFEEYWDEADVLNESRLQEYEALCSSTPGNSMEQDLDKKIKEAFGDTKPSQGVQIQKKKRSSEKSYLEDYRRTYQEFFSAYREVKSLYQGDGRRQQPTLPLRIEIDQFFSYIRSNFTSGESYLEAPLRLGNERQELMREKVEEWFEQRWEWLDTHIIEVFPILQNSLGSRKSIEAASMEDLVDALEICHAFKEMLRYYPGGEPTLRKEFSESNDLVRVKRSLIYLLHGKDDFIDRMGAVIFDPDYKLKTIGRSVVQELLGWVNKEEIPICNGRTMKALRYLGFDLPA